MSACIITLEGKGWSMRSQPIGRTAWWYEQDESSIDRILRESFWKIRTTTFESAGVIDLRKWRAQRLR